MSEAIYNLGLSRLSTDDQSECYGSLRLRILQILQGVDNPSAGPTYSVGSLSHYLAKRNHDVTVITFGGAPKIWPYLSKLKVYGGPYARFGLAPPEAIREIRQCASTPAILHGHGVWRSSNLFPLFLNKDSSAKLVWSPRGMFSPWAWKYKVALKRPFWHLLQHPALRRVDCFHATAENEMEDIRRLNFRQPIAVIPNGVEIPDVSRIQKTGSRLVFLSRIHEKKGLHLLIPAWKAIADRFPDWELLIAGKIDSAYGDDMVRLAEQIRATRLKFLGEVLGEKKKQLLASARLFVLPTFSENFGIAIAEALAHGTPAITTVETPWTWLADKGCGWCINPETDVLQRTLIDAMSRPSSELDAMGAIGRHLMEKEYGWDRVAEMMELVYRWLLLKEPQPDHVFV